MDSVCSPTSRRGIKLLKQNYFFLQNAIKLISENTNQFLFKFLLHFKESLSFSGNDVSSFTSSSKVHSVVLCSLTYHSILLTLLLGCTCKFTPFAPRQACDVCELATVRYLCHSAVWCHYTRFTDCEHIVNRLLS